MYYIENRTKEEAAKYIASRICQDYLEKYATAEEILDHLKEIYIDLNYLEIAKHDYNKLIIKNEDDYYKFITSFLHLAITAAYVITSIFKNFQELCSKSAYILNTIAAAAPRN
ncbi:hypothetical protein AJ80_05347 [Polytolypa hystricis UAMH7299]|uniref:Uncharacterized protein n=1 Tax=Polytolypa hystricis (strain UAMH7299) TaxID=1447883 RepID=A0A2B7Y4J9_POLH7|nr:hypothetical protein AJ80_05347 [Polytolypa hystricis UAMH7299]